MGDRSFLDEKDRRWLANKRDKTIMWVFLIVLVLLAIAYWPLVVVAIVVGGVWLVLGRKSGAQPNTSPVAPSTPAVPTVARTASPARKRVNTVLLAMFTYTMWMIPIGFVGLCLFWFIAAHTR